MGRSSLLLLGTLSVLLAIGLGDWNIFNQKTKNGVSISLKNYCESWRINVELHNIRDFEVVPGECVDYIGKYVTSTQYKVDSERALEECTIYLSNSFQLTGDGKDAWIFDVDDTLLSTKPYYKKHNYGGERLNGTSLEGWMKEAKAPALQYSLDFYNDIKVRGLKIFLISSRREHLRDATINNLVKVGYHGWTGLILRFVHPTQPNCFEEHENFLHHQHLSGTNDHLHRSKYCVFNSLDDHFGHSVSHPIRNSLARPSFGMWVPHVSPDMR